MSAASPDPRRWWILGVLSLSLLILSLDNTILNVALPTLERELGASSSELQWIVDAYLLVFAGLLLTMGALGDRFGRKKALSAGLGIFGAGSLLAALSGDSDLLIASRALMGVGGALVMPATLSIVTNVFPAHERGKAIGIWAGVSGLGIAIGPTAGGFLLEHFAWGSVFLVNLPIVALALAAGHRLVPESRDPATPPLDLLGAALSIAGLGAVVYGLIEAPAAGWTAPETLVAFGFGAAVLAMFAWWELRAEHPMLDVRLFRLPSFGPAAASVGLVFFGLFGSIFFLTQYMQGVLGLSALEAGVWMLPTAGGMVVSAPLSAVLAARIGIRLTVGAGMTIVSAGLLVMLFAGVDSGFGLLALSQVVLAVGIGLSMAPATDSVMGSLPLAKAGVGSAMNDTTRMVGGALGVAVLGSVLSSAYRGGMDGTPAVAQDSLAGALATGFGDTAREAFVSGMHTAVIVAAAVVLAGAIVALRFMPRERRVTAQPAAAAA